MAKRKKKRATRADAGGSLSDRDLDGVSGGGVVIAERPNPALGGPDTKSSTQLGPAPHLGPVPHLVPDGSQGGT